MHRFKKKCICVVCTETTETIDLGNTVNPVENGDRMEFCITEELESSTKNVELLINEVAFRLLSCATNNIKADQIKKYTKYAVVLGTEEPSARLLTPVCPTAYVFPVITYEPLEPVTETGGAE